MKTILSALVAEQQLLDQYIQSIPIREWNKKTRYKSMTVTDQISYLAGSEDLAFNAIKKKGTFFSDYKGPNGKNKFAKVQVDRGRSMRPQDVIEWWRLSRAKMIEVLAKASQNREVNWWNYKWDMRTFVMWKLSETWAHTLDIYDLTNDTYNETTRLEHITEFGWSQVQNIAKINKIKDKELRIELIGPEYKVWQYGPVNADNLIKGNAGDWCRLITGRAEFYNKLNLEGTGNFATRYLKFKHPMM